MQHKAMKLLKKQMHLMSHKNIEFSFNSYFLSMIYTVSNIFTPFHIEDLERIVSFLVNIVLKKKF